MKIQYCSDLHLEFPENREFMMKHPLKPEGDILLLAGDIVPFRIMDNHSEFFSWISDNFETTYWLPGNHEYYYSDINERSGFVHEKIRDNVLLVNNTSFDIGNTRLIFSTLWTKISHRNQLEIRQRLSDFHAIKKDGKGFSPDDYNLLHEQALNFLKCQLAINNDGKKIVITHHVPTFLNYPELYKGDSLNEAFAVELFNLIKGSVVSNWIYGHHHFNNTDFNVGNTSLRTNQLGYIQYRENLNYSNEIHILL
jgi:predicted phosphohydrolase